MCFLRTFLFVCLTYAVHSSCPGGWVSHDSRCYHFSHDREQFTSAAFICMNWDSKLVEITNQKDSAFVGSMVGRMNGTFWIGLTDLEQENIWLWYSTHEETQFTNWGPNEPNNADLNENCVEINDHGTHWNDVPCEDPRKYICEKEDS